MAKTLYKRDREIPVFRPPDIGLKAEMSNTANIRNGFDELVENLASGE